MGDKRGIAAALGAIGSASFQSNDFAGSVAPLAEAAALARELGDRRQAAYLLAYLALAVGNQGDLARAEALAAEGEALARSLGDAPSYEAAFVVLAHGWLALMAAAHDRAEERLAAALALGRALAAKAVLSAALGGLGEVALARGQVGAAAGHYREGLVLSWEVGWPGGTAFNLQGLARVAVRRGDHARVASLAGTVDAVGGPIRVLPGATAEYEAAVARAREALGEAAFAGERAAGRVLPPEEAVAEAVAAEATEPAAPPAGASPPSPRPRPVAARTGRAAPAGRGPLR